MSLTGYGWATMHGLVDGLTLADVIGDKGGGDRPADGARDILLVGMDSRTDAQGNPLPDEVLAQLRAGAADGELNTDSLILVHIPNDTEKAVAISLPRDSYVDIPSYGEHKINSAYMRAKSDARDRLENQGISDAKQLEVRSNQEGAKTLIGTVERLTGSTIDNYASINLLGFDAVTKAVGGVDVCLNDPVKDPYSGADFHEGRQTVQGVDALAFVRQRHGLPRGDLDRVVRQQVFMAGLANKILSAGTLADPGKLNELVSAVQKSVVLNKGWDVFEFAQQMKGLTGGNIEFQTVPIADMDYETPDDGSAIKVDPGEVRDYMRRISGQPPPAPAPPDKANAGTSVDVRNAAGATGLAADVAGRLTSKGFARGETGNAAARDTSVIRVPPGEQAAGDRVAKALGETITVERDNSVQRGHVEVYLGADYAAKASRERASGNGGSDNSANQSPSRGSSAGGSGAAMSSGGRQQPAEAPDDDDPITADGVTCVN